MIKLNCPNCGAQLNLNGRESCPYCGTFISSLLHEQKYIEECVSDFEEPWDENDFYDDEAD